MAREPLHALTAPLSLFVGAALWHAGWALTVPGPLDWDPAYYRDVAVQIAEGHGALTGAAWHRLGPDLPLPAPADLHWMPLPSRALVPGLWLWPDRGDQLMTVLFAAGWAPLAWLLARQLGVGARGAALAGLLAAGGGGYVRFLSTPDSIALMGLLGGLAWLAASAGRALPLAAVAALIALCRGDALLWSPCLALAVRSRGVAVTAAVAAVGPGANLLWQIRNVSIAGDAYVRSRERLAAALHIEELLRGEVGAHSGIARAGLVLAELREWVVTFLLSGVFLVAAAALVEAARRRREPLIQAWAAALVLAPAAALALAPAVAASGSLFRTGAGLFPLTCALAAVGATAADRAWGGARASAGLLAAGLLGSGALGLANLRVRPAPAVDCAALVPIPEVDPVVLSGRPLLVRAVCGPRAAVLGPDAAAVAADAARLGARWAWLPATDAAGLPTRADAARLLPGWREVSAGLYERGTP